MSFCPEFIRHPQSFINVEDGAEFEQGLFGDMEYIQFEKDHISKGFTKLIQGIRFIERKLMSNS